MRYSALLKIAKLEENEILESISHTNLKLSNLNEVIKLKNNSINHCKSISNNPTNIMITMSALNHIDLLYKELNILNNQKQIILNELELLNNRLSEKKSERKGLEKLIENHKKIQMKHKEKKEQNFLDELNSIE